MAISGRPSNPPEMSQGRALSPVEEGLGLPSRKAIEVAEWGRSGLGGGGGERLHTSRGP